MYYRLGGQAADLKHQRVLLKRDSECCYTNFTYFVCVMDNSAYDEKRLLQRVSEGDEAAFRELFYHYADMLGNYVMRLTRSRTNAEEIVQDVFLSIWMCREVLAEVENFKAYLFVVSRNQTLNAMRKMIRQANHQKQWERNQVPDVEIEIQFKEEENAHHEGLIEGDISQLHSQQQKD